MAADVSAAVAIINTSLAQIPALASATRITAPRTSPTAHCATGLSHQVSVCAVASHISSAPVHVPLSSQT